MRFNGWEIALHTRYPNSHGRINGNVDVFDDDVIFGNFVDGDRRGNFDLEDASFLVRVLVGGHLHESDLGVELDLRV